MSKFTKSLVAVAASAALVVGSTTPASASTYYTGGKVYSTQAFKTGTTTYYQHHAGDDFAFNVQSGISVDMRWRKCGSSHTTGEIKYDIHRNQGRRIIGTNFRRNTCLNLDYRGYIHTGSFGGTTTWNYNFA